jgi:deoxyribose-phosphate aldolase
VTTTAATAELLDSSTVDDASLRRWLRGLPGVDEVGARARAAALSTRSIKAASRAWALDLTIRAIDLTTLEGADTPATVRSLCAKARRPDPDDPHCPPVAAVCLYPDLVPVAVEALRDTDIKIASVATAFPSGRAKLPVKLAEVADAVRAGADEVDMVIDRGAFLSGRYGQVFDEIVAVREACQARSERSRAPCRDSAPDPVTKDRDGTDSVRLKVILETGDLATYDNIRRASWLAMLAGADFIKTSTGKVSPAATLPVTLIMLEAVRDWFAITGKVIGVKPAGGIRAARDAIRYLVMVNETAGPDWLNPDRFRFGASGLLNDVLLQRRRMSIGAYAGRHHVTVS